MIFVSFVVQAVCKRVRLGHKFPTSRQAPEGHVQEKAPRSFRQVLVRVMAVQVITLALLGWLQYHYGR